MKRWQVQVTEIRCVSMLYVVEAETADEARELAQDGQHIMQELLDSNITDVQTHDVEEVDV